LSAISKSITTGRKKKVLIEPFFPSGESVQAINNQAQLVKEKPAPYTARKAVSEKQVTPLSKTPPKSLLSGLGVSISAFSKEKDKPEETAQIKQQEVLSNSFTPLELITEWKAYAETLTEEHHLKNTMLNCLPDLLNRDSFEVVVNNPVQEQRLLDNATNILTFLRANLRNTNILMKVRVTVDNEKKLGFTTLEKYNLMVEQNETLKKLKDEFGLELM